MKRLFYLFSALVLCLGIIFYKQTPTYNPFDDVFDIDVNQLQEYDTIIGMCTDISFEIKNTKRLKIYYKVSGEDMNDVIAKGFYYLEDTISSLSTYNSDNYSDSLKKLSIDIKEFNEALSEFGYCYLDKNQEESNIRIIHKTNLDTVTTSLGWCELENDSTKIVRFISYHRSKSTIIRNENNEFIIK